MAFFVGRRSGDVANNFIYDGGGIGLLVVAESVHGDGGLALFDGSMGSAKVFLKSWQELWAPGRSCYMRTLLAKTKARVKMMRPMLIS